MATCWLLLTFHPLPAQEKHNATPIQQPVYFETGQSTLSPQAVQTLNTLYKRVTAGCSILIEGHTDSTGKHADNILLAQKRALAVKKYLHNAGIADTLLTTMYLGAQQPAASNSTETGRKQNRRVVVTLVEAEASDVTADVSVSELYRQLETPPQKFTLNGNKDTVIRCKGGTVIYIKAGTLLPLSPTNKNNIVLHVKECLKVADMLRDNLSTTAGNDLIETSGMIYTEAFDSEGNPLQIQNNQSMLVSVPAADTINPAVQLFDGHRQQGHQINWVADKNEMPSGFSIPDCLSCLTVYNANTYTSYPYGIVERIFRFPYAVAGLFSKSIREDNKMFREENKKDKIKYKNDIPDTNFVALPMHKSPNPACRKLSALFWKYRAFNDTALIKEMNRPLLEQYGMRYWAAFTDSIAKARTTATATWQPSNITSIYDVHYYTFSITKLEWKNLDMFLHYPANSLTKVSVNINPRKNTDCKLIFKSRKVIVPAVPDKKTFTFNGVPRGEKATLMVVKYEKDQLLLGLKDIEADNTAFDVALQPVTFAELKQELQKFD